MVTHARRVVGATWVAVVDIDERGDGVLAADAGAPSAGWLEAFLAGSRAAEGVNRGRGSHRSDVIWTPMAHSGLALVLGRQGMPYRSRAPPGGGAGPGGRHEARELHRARSRASHPSR